MTFSFEEIKNFFSSHKKKEGDGGKGPDDPNKKYKYYIFGGIGAVLLITPFLDLQGERNTISY